MLIGTPPSSNLQSLKSVVASLKIEEDPWVIDQHAMLRCLKQGPDCICINQHLSQVIDKHDTFTHMDLHNFERATEEIRSDLGMWAMDWYIQQVCEQAKHVGELFLEFSFLSSESERDYLLISLHTQETDLMTCERAGGIGVAE